jgi:hypothetical protein
LLNVLAGKLNIIETSAKVSGRIAALGCPYSIEAQARAPTLHFDE